MDANAGKVNNSNMSHRSGASAVGPDPGPGPDSPAVTARTARTAQVARTAGSARVVRHLPAYALYGGSALAPALEAVHAESIATRSRAHGWEIRPHRHESLCQLLVVRRGRVQVQLDGQSLALRGPALVALPALAAHGFQFSDGIDGWIFTLAEAHWRGLCRHDAALAELLARPRATVLPGPAARQPATRAVLAAAQALHAEHQVAPAPLRQAALDAAVLRLAVASLRAWPAQPGATATAPVRALAHVQGLRALIDAQFRQQPTLAALAQQLRITPTQLNRACQQVLGHSASKLQHQRLLLQAQRDLAYTTMTVAEIALELGFCEAGYFTRFFRQRLGCTPGQWRLQAQAAPRASG
jgi:AraC family transcriptional regulator, transcriptional activator of pobA